MESSRAKYNYPVPDHARLQFEFHLGTTDQSVAIFLLSTPHPSTHQLRNHFLRRHWHLQPAGVVIGGWAVLQICFQQPYLGLPASRMVQCVNFDSFI
jgi:hypothetical protein